ncbi:hypothetical protein Tco_0662038 [Tanacetum coccineum]
MIIRKHETITLNTYKFRIRIKLGMLPMRHSFRCNNSLKFSNKFILSLGCDPLALVDCFTPYRRQQRPHCVLLEDLTAFCFKTSLRFASSHHCILLQYLLSPTHYVLYPAFCPKLKTIIAFWWKEFLVEHEIYSEVQQSTVIDSNNVDMGNSNVIPYEQYLTTNDVSVVPSCASSAPNTAYVLIDNNVHTPNEPLVTELAIYKEQVAIIEQTCKLHLLNGTENG